MEIEAFRRRLGTAVRARRRAAGLTQEALAERTEASTEWISQVERGLGSPSLDLLLRVADAVGCSPVDLVVAACDPDLDRQDLHELVALAAGLGAVERRMLLAAARAAKSAG